MEFHVLSLSEEETIRLAYLLASFSTKNCSIYLYSSSIGLGKTSFCRGFLRGLGYLGHVKSPSYTLVESYVLKSLIVYHFDFYRLHAVEELECIGIQDFFNSHSLRLVEWPNLLDDTFPKEDISINFEYHQSFITRKITLKSVTTLGQWILKKFLSHGNMVYAESVKI